MEFLRSCKNILSMVISRCVGSLRDFAAPVRERISDSKSQKKLILTIVCIALLLDNMLYMVIVPIITEYFKHEKKIETTAVFLPNTTSWNISGSVLGATVIPKSLHSTSVASVAQRTTGLANGGDYPANEDALTGILFASKAIVQLMANPFTGTLIDRVGYVIPLTGGLTVMFASTTLFALAEGYVVLFLARSMQGLGSALADTASLGLIADRFTDEQERSKALGIALAFISFGSLVAPPFGGFLCEYAGREWPFLILAFVCLVDAMLLLLVQIPASDEKKAKDGNVPVGTPIYKLFVDPYIAVIALALMIANFPLAFLEPTIAKWMEINMHADKFQIGLVWLPAFIPHVIGVYLTVRLTVKYFRYQWLYGALGLVLIGVSTAAVPTCKTYAVLMLPLAFMCFGIALVDTALLPTLAFLVDVRHTSVYGSVYAIADISYSIAYSLGPILAGQTVHVLGYLKMNVGIGLVNMMFAPLLLFLKEVYDWKPDKSERTNLLETDIVPDIPKVSRDDKNIAEENAEPNGDVQFVTHHLRTRHGSVVSSEDDEELSTSRDSRRFKRKDLARNGSLKSSDNLKVTPYGNEESVIKTSVKPRPRPRTSLKKNNLNSVKEGDLDNAYQTTIIDSDSEQAKQTNSNFLYSTASKLGVQPSLSRDEIHALADSGVELHNPLFDNNAAVGLAQE